MSLKMVLSSQSVSVLAVALLSLGVIATNAFTMMRPSSVHLLPPRSLALSSSMDPNDEDELSKLIGKRNEIKRKRKAEEDIVERDALEFDISEDSLNWDNLPEFKTSRPVRKKKSSSEEKNKKKDEEEKDKGLDFLLDYADENEFHVPNRIGVTTAAWGDPTLGFVAGGKLTKKMRREGKFVPGDLQVCDITMRECIMLSTDILTSTIQY